MSSSYFTRAMRGVVYALRAHHATRYRQHQRDFPGYVIAYAQGDKREKWLRYAVKMVHNYEERTRCRALMEQSIAAQRRRDEAIAYFFRQPNLDEFDF